MKTLVKNILLGLAKVKAPYPKIFLWWASSKSRKSSADGLANIMGRTLKVCCQTWHWISPGNLSSSSITMIRWHHCQALDCGPELGNAFTMYELRNQIMDCLGKSYVTFDDGFFKCGPMSWRQTPSSACTCMLLFITKVRIWKRHSRWQTFEQSGAEGTHQRDICYHLLI